MASLPPSQRPSSSSVRPSQQSSSPLNSPGSNQDSSFASAPANEPVLLNPHSSSHQEQREHAGGVGSAERPEPTSEEDVDVRRCWICFSDETEDTPLSSSWRSPCPCALTAHEACILDWVADLEGSGSRQSSKILCPQCKSQILIARPRSIFLDLVKALERSASRMVIPSIVVLGTSTVGYLSMLYGAVAVHMVLGTEAFQKIFAPDGLSVGQAFRRLYGLSVIPWMLVLSRTSIADGVLPIVPMLFFVTQSKPDPLEDFSTWPPSAGLSFALLPYVRAAYNSYYELVWGDRVRRWMEEVKPRGTSESSRPGDLELEIAVEHDEEFEEEERGQAQDQQRHEHNDNEHEEAPGLHEPPLDHIEPAPQAAPQVRIEGQARIQDIVVHGERHRTIDITSLTQSVLGALLFPAISATMGELLRAMLPLSWTLGGKSIEMPLGLTSLGKSIETRTGLLGVKMQLAQKPTRFLQTRWGRSIVGGCLFVVIKDAVALYVRWKMAQNHRKRRVVDYDKSRAEARNRR